MVTMATANLSQIALNDNDPLEALLNHPCECECKLPPKDTPTNASAEQSPTASSTSTQAAPETAPVAPKATVELLPIEPAPTLPPPAKEQSKTIPELTPEQIAAAQPRPALTLEERKINALPEIKTAIFYENPNTFKQSLESIEKSHQLTREDILDVIGRIDADKDANQAYINGLNNKTTVSAMIEKMDIIDNHYAPGLFTFKNDRMDDMLNDRYKQLDQQSKMQGQHEISQALEANLFSSKSEDYIATITSLQKQYGLSNDKVKELIETSFDRELNLEGRTPNEIHQAVENQKALDHQYGAFHRFGGGGLLENQKAQDQLQRVDKNNLAIRLDSFVASVNSDNSLGVDFKVAKINEYARLNNLQGDDKTLLYKKFDDSYILSLLSNSNVSPAEMVNKFKEFASARQLDKQDIRDSLGRVLNETPGSLTGLIQGYQNRHGSEAAERLSNNLQAIKNEYRNGIFGLWELDKSMEALKGYKKIS